MFRNAVIIFAMVFLAGCGTSSTIVMDPVKQQYHAKGVTILIGRHNVAVPSEVVMKLKRKIEKGLYQDNNFSRSGDLLLECNFLQQEQGSRFARWFSGGIGNMGEASLTVRVTYALPNGIRLGQNQVYGKISSGFFGGSFDDVIDKVAEEIIEFTVSNFSS